MDKLLSAGQLWRQHVVGTNINVHNMVFYYKIILKNLNISLLEEAINSLDSYYPLNTIISEKTKQPICKIIDTSITDLQLWVQKLQNKLDTSLFYIQIVQTIAEEKFMLIKANHLYIDAKSIDIILETINASYSKKMCSYSMDQGFALFIKQEQQLRNSINYQQRLQIKVNSGIDIKQNLQPCQLKIAILSKELIKIIQHNAKQLELSFFCAAYGWFASCVNKLFTDWPHAFGMIFSERMINPKYYQSVGAFSNPVLMLDLEKKVGFQQCAKQVYQQVITCLQNQHLRLIDLYNNWQAQFNILFDYQDDKQDKIPFYNGYLVPQEMPMPNVVRRTLSVKMVRKVNEYILKIRFDPQILSKQQVQQLIEQLNEVAYNKC